MGSFRLAVVPLLAACLEPTEITLRITSDDCAAITQTGIALGFSTDFTTTQGGCESPGTVGSLVVVPGHSPDDLVELEVVAGLGKDPTTCTHADPQCIVARRTLRFIAHTPLTLPIALDSACAGVACDDPTTTCSGGRCIPIAVICASGTCTLDAGFPDANVVDASPDVAVEAGPSLQILAKQQLKPKGIHVDATDVYWTNADTNGSIMKCAIGGCVQPTIVASNQDGPASIAGDSKNVYWTNFAVGGQVALAPKSGGATVPLATNLMGAFEIATSNNVVYWTDNLANTVSKCPVTGCNNTPTLVASAQNGAGGIAVDGAHVYWTTTYGNQIMSCTLPSCSAPVLIASGQSSPERMTTDGTNVYWTNFISGTVMKCSATACTTPTTIATGQLGPLGIATDATDVYWTTTGNNGTVMKCAKTGCASPTTLASGQQTPWSVAVDATSVYWTNRDDGTIARLTPK